MDGFSLGDPAKRRPSLRPPTLGRPAASNIRTCNARLTRIAALAYNRVARMSKRKVFISSVSKELDEYRQAVIEAVREEDAWEPVHMETFGAKDAEPDAYCRALVRECDAFVGILGSATGRSWTAQRDVVHRARIRRGC